MSESNCDASDNATVVTQTAAFTIALAAVCAAAVAAGSPWGLSTDGFGNQAVGFICIGLSMSIPIGLGAWAALRDKHHATRFAAPVVLLMMLSGASALGERWNFVRGGGLRTIDYFVIFGVACIVFVVTRVWFGWKLIPKYEGDHKLTLPHLFLWTTVAAFAFAIVAWVRIEATDFLPSGMTAISAMVGLVTSVLGIGCVGLVFDQRKRRLRYYVLLAVASVPLLVVVIASYRSGGNELELIFVQATFVLFLLWCFTCYRSLGYSFDSSDPPPVGSIAKWLVCLVGLLLLTAYSPVAMNVFAEQRATKEFQASWAQHGVYPLAFDDKLISGVLFRVDNMPMTNSAVAALEGQPLQIVEIRDHVPEEGSLKKIVAAPSMEYVRFEGSQIKAAHLEELYDATHLKEVTFRNVPRLTPNDIDALRKTLPNCNVEMH